ncbi:MAG: DUF4358 domain-containing protein [Ruminococcus sp.]|nr:DUF4358 domain-containing protein [Ruminococcus sp.]
MKKLLDFILIVLCFASLCLLSACVGDAQDNTQTTAPKNTKEPATNVVLSNVLASINQEFSITEDLVMSIENTDDLELFYNIAPSDVKQFAAQTAVNTATDIDEIILVEAVDMDAAQRVYDALLIRYNSQKDLCASYSAELLAIIEKCSVEKNGNFVTLIMSSNAKEITEYYNSLV